MPSDAEYFEAIKGRYGFELPTEYRAIREAGWCGSVPPGHLSNFVGDTMWFNLREILEYRLFDGTMEIVPFATDDSGDCWCWSPKNDGPAGTPVLRCYHDDDYIFYAPNFVGWLYRRLLDYACDMGWSDEEERANVRSNLHVWQDRLRSVFPDQWYQTIDAVRHREDLPEKELDGIVSRDLAFPLLDERIAPLESSDATQVTDAGLEHLRWMISLKELYLWETQITDAALQHVAALHNLEYLNLDSTRITDAGLAHLKGLTTLQELDLPGTQVTDEGIKKLQQALPNCKISH